MDERERSGGPAELWLPVSAELIAGVHHALNNRVGALSAVAQVLEGDMDPHHPLREALAMEVERLQTTVRTLALLPRRVGAAPEPIHLPGLLPLIMELLSYHLGVRDTECRVEGDGDTLPVYAEPTLLTHLLITLLVEAAGVARAEGTTVCLRHSSTAEWVTITVEAVGGGDGEPGPIAQRLRPWADEVGGEISAEGAGRFVLRLPTLGEVRRRER